MPTIIKSDELTEMFYTSFVEHKSHVQPDGLAEREFSCDLSTGKGSFTEISFDGIYLGYGNLALSTPTQIQYELHEEFVTMFFALEGHTVYRHEFLSRPLQFDAGHHNLFFMSEQLGKKDWVSSKSQSLKGLEISLSPQFFSSFFPENGRQMHKFLKGILLSQSAVLCERSFSITPAMRQIIHDILHCDKPMALKKLFLSSRVMDLLMLQIEQIQFTENDNTLPKGSKERLYAVKNYLESKLEPQFSLKTLAAQFGTNEFTLKREFKQLFGKSVFDYWNSLRFDYAKRVLKEGESIKQLAIKWGIVMPKTFQPPLKRDMVSRPVITKQATNTNTSSQRIKSLPTPLKRVI
ncbi:MAG: helix-turn-helix domain-containing protein [Croceivirga sp.]